MYLILKESLPYLPLEMIKHICEYQPLYPYMYQLKKAFVTHHGRKKTNRRLRKIEKIERKRRFSYLNKNYVIRKIYIVQAHWYQEGDTIVCVPANYYYAIPNVPDIVDYQQRLRIEVFQREIIQN